MEKGNVVRINYVGRIEGSGELFDTTRREVAEEENATNPNISYGPVPVIVGAEMVVEGVDEELVDMEVGDEKEITVPPEKAFGKREGDLIKTFSEKRFKDEGMTPSPGMRINMDGKMGRILSVNSGRVRVDLNHPLAGRTLKYEVTVEEEIEGEEDKVKAVAEFYLGEPPEIEMKDSEATIEVPEEMSEAVLEKMKDNIEEFIGVDVNFERVEKDETQGEAEQKA